MKRDLDMSAAAITARLRASGAQSDLSPETRLDAKLDLSPAGITARLREVSALCELCRRLAATKPEV